MILTTIATFLLTAFTAVANPATEPAISYTDEDIYNLTVLTVAEADGETELGQRLVIDSVLNRVLRDDFPNTITECVFQPNQYSGTGDRWERSCYKENIAKLVKEEIEQRTNKDVLYFKTKSYHSKYGTPMFKEGNHYFSGDLPELSLNETIQALEK